MLSLSSAEPYSASSHYSEPKIPHILRRTAAHLYPKLNDHPCYDIYEGATIEDLSALSRELLKDKIAPHTLLDLVVSYVATKLLKVRESIPGNIQLYEFKNSVGSREYGITIAVCTNIKDGGHWECRPLSSIIKQLTTDSADIIPGYL